MSARSIPHLDQAFADLYRRSYLVAFRLLGDRSEAEDVAQEALARRSVRSRHVQPHAHAWVAAVLL